MSDNGNSDKQGQKRKAESSGDEGKPAKRARGPSAKELYDNKGKAFDAQLEELKADHRRQIEHMESLRKVVMGKPPRAPKKKQEGGAGSGAESPAEEAEAKPKKGSKKPKADKPELTEEQIKKNAEKAAKRRAKRAADKAEKAAKSEGKADGKEAKSESKAAKSEPKADEASKAAKPAKKSSKKGKCAKCTTKPADMQFQPCQHVVLCSDCSDSFKFDTPCSKCKGEVKSMSSVVL